MKPQPIHHRANRSSKPTSTGRPPRCLELRLSPAPTKSDVLRSSDISFAAQEGEILCLLGPSGCGKTTILRAIAGFEPVRSGQIFLSGQLVSSPDVMTPTEDRHVGMVFQEYALFPHLRVQDNIAFGLRHLARSERKVRVQEMLRLIGLEGFERRYPHELSGGQQQRVALARALVQHPVVLLLDEPFSNLDPDMAGRMRQELHDLLRRTKTTTMLVTHDHDEAFAMADRIAVLNQGRLEQFDTPEIIYHMPATPFVADFVGQADFIPGTVSNGMVHTELGEFPDTIECRGRHGGRRHDSAGRHSSGAHERRPSHVLSRQFSGSENLYAVSLPPVKSCTAVKVRRASIKKARRWNCVCWLRIPCCSSRAESQPVWHIAQTGRLPTSRTLTGFFTILAHDRTTPTVSANPPSRRTRNRRK